MNTDLKEIEHSALELDERQRAELAKRLINSLDTPTNENIEQAWIDDIKHRNEEIESGKVTLTSGTEVHQEIRNRFKK